MQIEPQAKTVKNTCTGTQTLAWGLQLTDKEELHYERKGVVKDELNTLVQMAMLKQTYAAGVQQAV